MAVISELVRLAEADGATFIRSATGAWWARDKDGVTIARGALSRAEAALRYCEDKDVNRLPNLTPHRLPILTPLRGGVCW
jgi:hypothetical protein